MARSIRSITQAELDAMSPKDRQMAEWLMKTHKSGSFSRGLDDAVKDVEWDKAAMVAAAPFALGAGITAAGGAGAGAGAWGTAAQIGAPLLGGYLQSQAAGDAADTMSAATDRATQAQLAMFDAGQAATAPWRESGAAAQNEYSQLMGLGATNKFSTGGLPSISAGHDAVMGNMQGRSPEEMQEGAYDRFRNTPGYQFQMEEMRRNTEGAQSAGGRSLVGGSTLKALQDRSAGIADQSFGAYADRLQNMSTVGANAATNSASQMQALGNNQAQNFIRQGNISGQQSVDQANIASNTLQQLTQGYGQYQGGQNQYRPPSGAYGLAPTGTGTGALDPNLLKFDSGSAVQQQYPQYQVS